MKPALFEYIRPESLAQVCELRAVDEDARIIAGGQTLVPMLAMRLARPARLIDILRLPGLSGIREEDGAVVIGATPRQALALQSSLVRSALPLLAQALPYVIGRLRKNFTVSKDPLGDPDAALAALYYDTVAQDTRALRYLADVVGSGRIVLGSDMPFPIGDLAPLKVVADTSFSDAERQSINGGLAAKLFV